MRRIHLVFSLLCLLLAISAGKAAQGEIIALRASADGLEVLTTSPPHFEMDRIGERNSVVLWTALTPRTQRMCIDNYDDQEYQKSYRKLEARIDSVGFIRDRDKVGFQINFKPRFDSTNVFLSPARVCACDAQRCTTGQAYVSSLVLDPRLPSHTPTDITTGERLMARLGFAVELLEGSSTWRVLSSPEWGTLLRGDVIFEVNGQTASTEEEFLGAMGTNPAVQVKFNRGDDTEKVAIILARAEPPPATTTSIRVIQLSNASSIRIAQTLTEIFNVSEDLRGAKVIYPTATQIAAGVLRTKALDTANAGIKIVAPEPSAHNLMGGQRIFRELSEGQKVATSFVDTMDTLPYVDMDVAPENYVVIGGDPQRLQIAEQLIRDLDIKPEVINLKVCICELTERAVRNLGLNLMQTSGGGAFSGIGTTFAESPADGGHGFEAFSLGDFRRGGGQEFAATLNTLVQDGQIEILAAPSLSTVDGRGAFYFAGEAVPFIKQRINSVNERFEHDVTSASTVQVGISLEFVPKYDRRHDEITLTILPQIQTLLDYTDIGFDFKYPRIQKREMFGTIRVKNNEMFCLSGLIDSSEQTTVEKVPLLSELPLVGKLFRNKNHKGEHTTICMFITASFGEAKGY